MQARSFTGQSSVGVGALVAAAMVAMAAFTTSRAAWPPLQGRFPRGLLLSWFRYKPAGGAVVERLKYHYPKARPLKVEEHD